MWNTPFVISWGIRTPRHTRIAACDYRDTISLEKNITKVRAREKTNRAARRDNVDIIWYQLTETDDENWFRINV